MNCQTITRDIINSCSAVRGLYPTAWVLPYVGSKVDFSSVNWSEGDTQQVYSILNENQAAFTKITAVKMALNAGHDAVASDVRNTTFAHYFSAVLSLNAAQKAALDKMDGIIVVVRDKAGLYWVYGAENGLWKTTQSQRANDNTGLITVEYASQEGVEESFQDYQLISSTPFSIWDEAYYLNEASHEVMYDASVYNLESPSEFYFRSAVAKDDLPSATWVVSNGGVSNPVTGWTEFIYDTVAGIIIT